MNPAPQHAFSGKALIAYILGTLFFFYAFVQRVSPSVMTQELMREFSVGGAALGVLSAMYFYAYAAVQLPVGLLMDRYGPRKLMSAAAFVCMLSSLWFAFSDSLFSASLSRAFIGGSVAFSFVGTLTVASLFFPQRRFAIATGLLMSVGMAGAVAGQVPLRLLLEQTGWRQLYQLLALLALVLSVLLYLLVPKRPPQALNQTASKPGGLRGLREVLGNAQSWWCSAVGFGLSASMLSLAGLWAVPWLIATRGYTPAQAAATSSLMFIGFAIGSPMGGLIAAKVGKIKPVLLTASLLALLSIVLIVYGEIQESRPLSTLFFLNGLLCGPVALCFVLVRSNNKAEYNSTALGLINMCVVGSGAIMQPVIGWLLDRQWDGQLLDGARVYSASAYNVAFSSLVVTTVLALLCVIAIREP